ncbi:MAG: hypothetical protein QG635_752, partial [Bacteroidota bacterium]|nr:hypothetical protein [Bacteroidota bacterium]
MFESDIENVVLYLSDSINHIAGKISLSDLIENDYIDKSYKTYLIADSEWNFRKEKKARSSSPYFDFSDEETAELNDRLFELMKKNICFNSSRLEEVISSAAKVRLNILLRPQTTLKWFVFRGAATMQISEIVQRLRYFSDYYYLIDGFGNWAEKRNIPLDSEDFISVVEFEKVIRDIDNESVFDLSLDEFADLLDPMFDYFNTGKDTSAEPSVPIEALIIFHDDKGITPVAQALGNEYKKQGRFYITKSDFVKFMQDFIENVELENIAETSEEELLIDNASDNKTVLESEDSGYGIIDAAIYENMTDDKLYGESGTDEVATVCEWIKDFDSGIDNYKADESDDIDGMSIEENESDESEDFDDITIEEDEPEEEDIDFINIKNFEFFSKGKSDRGNNIAGIEEEIEEDEEDINDFEGLVPDEPDIADYEEVPDIDEETAGLNEFYNENENNPEDNQDDIACLNDNEEETIDALEDYYESEESGFDEEIEGDDFEEEGLDELSDDFEEEGLDELSDDFKEEDLDELSD